MFYEKIVWLYLKIGNFIQSNNTTYEYENSHGKEYLHFIYREALFTILAIIHKAKTWKQFKCSLVEN